MIFNCTKKTYTIDILNLDLSNKNIQLMTALAAKRQSQKVYSIFIGSGSAVVDGLSEAAPAHEE
jgi:hypothetical protein